MSEQQMLSTVCKECIWAKYEEKTQVGCELGRISQFENIGVEVIEAEDEEKEFYLIKDRICFAHRRNDWLEKNKGKDLVEKVYKELELTFDLLIYVDQTKTIDDLESCLWMITDCPPASVRVILDSPSIKLGEVIQLFQNNYSHLNWNVDHIQNHTNKEDAVNHSVQHCKSFLLAITDVGQTFGYRNINAINTYVNKKLRQFYMVLPTNSHWDCTIINREVFNKLGGNSSLTIVEKIKEIADDQNKQNMILTWEQLYAATS